MYFWREFSANTGIRYFTFICKSRSVVEKVFWILALSGCFCATSWDVFYTLRYFFDGPTSTKVTVLLNDSFNLEQPSVCTYISIDKAIRDQGIDLENSKEIETFLQRLNNINVSRLIDDEITKIESSTTYRPHLNDDFTKLMMLSGAVISNIIRVEVFIDRNFTTDKLGWGMPITDNEQIRLSDRFLNLETGDSLMLIYQFLLTKDLDLSDLIKAISSTICYMLKTEVIVNQVSSDNGTETHRHMQPCNRRDMTWLSIEPFYRGTYDLLCMRLPENSLYFNLSYEWMMLSMSKKALNIQLDKSSKGDHNEENKVYFDLSGSQVSTTLDKNVLSFMEGMENWITVKLSGHFKPLPSKKIKCSHQSKLDCLLQCRTNYIYRYCHCEPLVTVFLTTAFTRDPVCEYLQTTSNDNIIPGYNATVECLNIPHKNHPDEKCKNKCYPACNHKIHSYINTRHVKLNETDRTILVVQADPFSYPLYEDVYLVETKQLLGQLGGILSLWLGANFGVLLHTCVFCLSYVYFRGRNHTEVSQDQILEAKINRLVELKFRMLSKTSVKYPVTADYK